MTDPAAIVDRIASARGYVVPLPAYFPIGREFAEACVREALAEAQREATGHPKPETKEKS